MSTGKRTDNLPEPHSNKKVEDYIEKIWDSIIERGDEGRFEERDRIQEKSKENIIPQKPKRPHRPHR